VVKEDPQRVLVGLAEGLADEVVRRYRVTRDDAVELILEEWGRRPALAAAIEAANRPEDLRRLRVYRDAADAAKKAIYHHLRRYRQTPATSDVALAALADLDAAAPLLERKQRLSAVAAEHTSTAERMTHLDEFLIGLSSMMGSPRTIVDVGSGVFPVILPLDDDLAAVEEYWALDKDGTAVEALGQYARIRADGRLRPLSWDMADGWQAAHVKGLPECCDVGLLLKVVPVVARRSPELLAVLAETPAKRLVVSGSRTAMAKRQDIEWRESKLLRRFFGTYGFVELERFRTSDELLYLVTRS
jgi:Ribosomal RNA methyltransferase (FmrO)